MARATMDELCRTEPDRKVDFIAPEHGAAVGDRHLLRIVIENLLRNAWKYTSHHPSARIEFGRYEDAGRTLYFVRDDGSGFDAKSANRLFKPFQRLHSTDEFPGNGIGLATVKRIIQRHGGEVWAEGEVEKGSSFISRWDRQNNSSQLSEQESAGACPAMGLLAFIRALAVTSRELRIRCCRSDLSIQWSHRGLPRSVVKERVRCRCPKVSLYRRVRRHCWGSAILGRYRGLRAPRSDRQSSAPA